MIVRSRFFFCWCHWVRIVLYSLHLCTKYTRCAYLWLGSISSQRQNVQTVSVNVCVCVWLDKFIIVLIIELQYINLGAGVFPLNCMYIVCLSVPIILSLQFANYIRIILESLVLYRKRWSFSFLFIIILIIILFGYTTAGIIWLKCFSWYFLISFCWKFMFFMYVYRQCTVSWFFFSSNSI